MLDWSSLKYVKLHNEQFFATNGLQDLYIQQSENVISLKDPALSVFSDTHVETPSVAQDSSGPLKSRKWHERFGKGRR